jgi:adenosylmethionine---8-amino-7-oxononanoate aminotransferase
VDNWIKKDLKYNWHPYTQMKDLEKDPPIFIKKAKGSKLYDKNGKFYYDTISSWWCNIHGHCNKKILNTINKQFKKLDHVLFAGFTHEPAIKLSEKLIKITPKNLTKVFYSDNGSTAVEVALKMSFQYWNNIGVKNKTKFLCLDHGYHGDTIGAMSVSGVSLFNNIFFPLFLKSYKAHSPYCYRCPAKKQKDSCNQECIKSLENIIKKNHKNISAFIIEPLILCAGGMITYPKEYLVKAFQLAKKYNIHFIVDEIATGFGRTGDMFATNHINIQPDFMCLSKGLTSGTLPLGVTLTTDKIYNSFYSDYKNKKTFYHGHTFTANPLTCSIALTNLEIFEKQNVIKKTKKLIPYFKKELEKFKKLKIVGDARSIGLIGALELVKDKEKKTPFAFEEQIGKKIYKEGLKKHLILRPLGNVIYLFPPLCITKKELKYIFDNLYAILIKF